MEFVTIESHFGLLIPAEDSENHSIRVITRNICSQKLVEIITQVSSILYPDEEFEIYYLPSEPGGFKDIFKFVKKHPGKTALVGNITTLATVAGVVIAYLNYKDDHEKHEHDKKMWIIEETKNCLELAQQRNDLSERYDINNFPQEKIDQVCNNLSLQRKKNDRYRALRDDEDIINEEIVLRTDKEGILMKKTVNQENFEEYIQPIEIEEGFIKLEIEGIIELLVPVLKQRREGGGIKWKGIYHGDAIYYEQRKVLEEGDGLDFYMQDEAFKDKILAQDIVFKNGDNMAVKMRVTFFLSDSNLSRKTVYVEEVKWFNEDTIEHKIKGKKNDLDTIQNENQLSLF